METGEPFQKNDARTIRQPYKTIFQSIPHTIYIRITSGASLVVQWLGVRLPMQGTRVRALVQEDPTCRGETKPMHHNY